MLAILFVSGTARAFETPTMHTLVPGIVPPGCCRARSRRRPPRARPPSSAVRRSAGFSMCSGRARVYLTARRCSCWRASWSASSRCSGRRPTRSRSRSRRCSRAFATSATTGGARRDLARSFRDCYSAASPRCCRSMPRTYSRRPVGARLLRSAPAIGALAISIWLAHHQIGRRRRPCAVHRSRRVRRPLPWRLHSRPRS